MARSKNTDFSKLPASELLIMQCIWNLHAEGVENIHASLLKERFPEQVGHLALTTILTLITRLQTKGYVTLEKRRRTNCIIPLVDRTDYQRRVTTDFLSTVYNNNKKGLISALCSEGIFTEDDLDELRREIEEDSK